METNFTKRYRDLEMEVHAKVRELVKQSKQESQFIVDNVIKTNVIGFDYREFIELTIVDDRLFFLDTCGNYFAVWAVCNLETLIEIIEPKK